MSDIKFEENIDEREKEVEVVGKRWNGLGKL